MQPRSLASLKRPGVDIGIVLPGWSVASSFFSYRLNNYNTNFGSEQSIQLGDLPELYFHVIVRRLVLSPFVSNLLPLIVVAFLLFALLMVTRSSDSTRKASDAESGAGAKQDLLGFSAAGHVTSCAALFFVVILSHIDLRRQVQADRIVYMESFYFIAYIAILLVATNAVLVGQRTPIPGIQYRDNLMPRLLFWPFVLTAVLGMTLRYFY